MKRILIINQALNETFLQMYKRIIEKLGSGTIITGSADNFEESGVRIVRAPKHMPSTLFSRLTCWFQFLLFTHRFLRKRKEHYDIVLVFSNPPIAPLYASYLNKIKNWPYIVQIWDIYPDFIEKMFRSIFLSPIVFLWRRLNSICLKKSLQIITIGSYMKEAIIFHHKQIKDKITVIPNWADPMQIKPMSKESNPFCISHGLVNKFIVMYSGKMGLGHGIKEILLAAQCLQDDEAIQFVMIGHGPGFRFADEFICCNELKNVTLLSLVSNEDFPCSVAMADVGIVSQERNLNTLFFPSKLYNLMSAGVAILGIGSPKSDLSDTIQKYNVGIAVENGDVRMIVESIRLLKESPHALETFKRNSRKAVVDFFNPDIVFSKYLKVFRDSNVI